MVLENKKKKEQELMVVLKSIQKSFDWRNGTMPNYTREFNEAQLQEWKDKQDNRFNALSIAIKCVRACKAVNELPMIWQKAIREVEKLDEYVENAYEVEL